MLHTACKIVLEEVLLPGSAPGGMVEYKRTLMISFFFKFYLKVLQGLKLVVSSFPLLIFLNFILINNLKKSFILIKCTILKAMRQP